MSSLLTIIAGFDAELSQLEKWIFNGDAADAVDIGAVISSWHHVLSKYELRVDRDKCSGQIR